jgi:tetratricopeptide (TPR) repeat protein/predicted Ser/Thr protein kinase
VSSPLSVNWEQVLDRFEDAWNGATRPCIEDFLLPCEPSQRLSLLIELVRIDLERRLTAGDQVRVEEAYLRRFPELNAHSQILVALATREFELRRRREPGLTVEEYVRRFPSLAEDLRRLLPSGGEGAEGDRAGATVIEATHSTNHPGPRPPSGEEGVPRSPSPERSNELPDVPGYEVLEFLARGGMGAVYKARHRLLGRLVAIKIPFLSWASDPGERQRFLREARSAARLRHPHICPIHEVGQIGDCPYLVMGYIHGPTLGQWARSGQPSARQAAEMTAKIARAVACAHACGVIHRDIKPANIMVETETGQPILMDFGLAKELAEHNSFLSQSGQIMGTPAYMAPEQAAGRLSQIGPQSDVYALGVVLYELLCQRLPFQGGVGEVLQKIQTEEPPAPRRIVPRLHRDLETICLKAMAKSPTERYTSADELADDLERFGAGEAIRARREGIGRKLWRKVRRNPLTFAALLVLIVSGAMLGIVGPRLYRTARISSLSQTIQSKLDAEEWPPEQRDAVEALLDKLQPLAAEDAETRRHQLHQRVANAVDSLIRDKSKLEEEDSRRIEETLDWLQARAWPEVDSLRRAYGNRLSAWKTVLDLKPPFENAAELSAGALVRVGEGELQPRPRSGAEADQTILLSPACAAYARLTAVFGPSWKTAKRIGLVLNAAPGQGYTFHVCEAEADNSDRPLDKPPASREALRPRPEVVQLRILRNGQVLRALRVPAAELFAGADNTGLYLEASREGDRLRFQVNRLSAVEFRDAFPLPTAEPGKWGLDCPANVTLRHLHAEQLKHAAAPSNLERADALYIQGDYERASQLYQEALGGARRPAERVEIEYKTALCLVARNRREEAIALLRQVAGAEGDPWPLLADGQLLLLLLQKGQRAEADVLLDKLYARHGNERGTLATFLSKEACSAIAAHYMDAGVNLLMRQPEPFARACRQSIKVFELLDPSAPSRYSSLFWAKLTLVKAERAIERHERQALQIAENMLADYGPETEIVEQYCWLLRGLGRGDRALELVNRLLGSGPSVLLVERARLHADRQDWSAAENDLDTFFRWQEQAKSKNYIWFSDACLLRGFLHQRRGDQAAAREIWRRGILRNWLAPGSNREVFARATTPRSGVHSLILASLTDDLNENDAEMYLTWLLQMNAQFGDRRSPVSSMLRALTPSAAELRPVFASMWQTPRGQEWARKIAFRDLLYRDCVRIPAFLLVAERLHQKAFPPGALNAEQDALLWQLVQDGYAAYLDGKIGNDLFAAFGPILKGYPNLPGFGWKKVADSLGPSIRGPMAYVFGQRYLRLHKPKEAAEFFRAARDPAPADSPLRRLAQAELDRLKAP